MNIKLTPYKTIRWAYGFDDISLVPSACVIDPEQIDISLNLGNIKLSIPVIASAMDGVVDKNMAVKLGKLGGIAVLNLEGVQTRYKNPKEVLNKIAGCKTEEVITLIQKIYQEPIKLNLIEERILQIKKENVAVAVSATPANAEKFAEIAVKAGADIFVVQSTVTTADYKTNKGKPLSFKEFCKKVKVPVIVGNCVSYEGAYKLMETGVVAVLVGVGPGAACTTRRVVGIGVPQVTAIADVASARNDYFKKSKKYIAVIADGGMRVGGDLAKAIASGADGVMLGSPLASAKEAPGQGHHWGMATSHSGLPRGTRIKVGILGSLEEILLGPAKKDDGTMNLIGALKSSMGLCGAENIKQMQKSEMVMAPSISTEGKVFQRQQAVGMGK